MKQSLLEEGNIGNDLLSFLKLLLNASKDLKRSCNPVNLALYCSPDRYYIVQNLIPRAEKLFLVLHHSQLSRIAQLLSDLITLINRDRISLDYTLACVLQRHFISYEIYHVSAAIESEIQGYLDREIVRNLITAFLDEAGIGREGKIDALKDFETRLNCDFDGNLQETILKGKVFNLLENLLCDQNCDTKIKEQATHCVLALVKFNKDVFFGLVLMGPIVPELIAMSSCCSIRILISLIQLIRTPLIDELECRGDIQRIVSLLETGCVCLRMKVVDCLCEMAYVGRKEVIEELLELKVVEKLVNLQRFVTDSGNGGGASDEEGAKSTSKTERLGCVLRFSIQVETGQGLSRKEKTELKTEILRRIRESSVSEAEATSLIFDVLWGSGY